MNREMWLRMLTVAVVAPYLYKLSSKEDGYYATGLKLVAGGLIAVNIVPLINDFSTLKKQAGSFLAQVQKAQATLDKAAKPVTTVDAEVTDAEFVETA